MSEHKASIAWERGEVPFSYDEYSRDHTWRMGPATVAASAAVEFLGSEDRVDPEAAFTASVASCHMLTFLAIAARKRWTVDSYQDDAVGYLEKNPQGELAVTRVVLRPRIRYSGNVPSPEDIRKVHHKSHQKCFIANSITTQVTVEDVAEVTP